MSRKEDEKGGTQVPDFPRMFSAGAARVAAAGAAATVSVSTAAEQKKQDHNEPDAGAVAVVKAHFFHLTYRMVHSM